MTTKTSTIISGSIDLATLVLWPYAVGFLTVMVYYSQYKLFHFNPISAQYVLVGAYVLALYFVTPYLLLRLFHRSSPRWSLPLKLLALLTIDVLICKVFIDMVWSAVLLFVATLFILQLGFLINQHGFFDLRFLKTPVKTAVFAVLAAFHFAWLFFRTFPTSTEVVNQRKFTSFLLRITKA